MLRRTKTFTAASAAFRACLAVVLCIGLMVPIAYADTTDDDWEDYATYVDADTLADYNHGSIEVSCDDATDGVISLEVGESATLTVSPYQHVQYQGCRMFAKGCPYICESYGKDDCFVEGYGCKCDKTAVLVTATVEADADVDGVVSVSSVSAVTSIKASNGAGTMTDGTFTVTGVAEGTVTLTVEVDGLYFWYPASVEYTVVVGSGVGDDSSDTGSSTDDDTTGTDDDTTGDDTTGDTSGDDTSGDSTDDGSGDEGSTDGGGTDDGDSSDTGTGDAGDADDDTSSDGDQSGDSSDSGSGDTDSGTDTDDGTDDGSDDSTDDGTGSDDGSGDTGTGDSGDDATGDDSSDSGSGDASDSGGTTDEDSDSGDTDDDTTDSGTAGDDDASDSGSGDTDDETSDSGTGGTSSDDDGTTGDDGSTGNGEASDSGSSGSDDDASDSGTTGEDDSSSGDTEDGSSDADTGDDSSDSGSGDATDDEDDATTVSYSFPDVQDSSKYYYASVYRVAELGIITGYDTGYFGVGDTLTRKQLAVILWRIACPSAAADYDASGAVSTTTKVTGISDGTYWTAAAEWAVEAGVINGKEASDGSRYFDPDGKVTFEQLVAIIANYYAYTNPTASDTADVADTSVLDAYTDGSSVSSWARSSVAWALEKGVIHGTDEGALKSTSYVTRGRAAVVFVNAIDLGILDV